MVALFLCVVLFGEVIVLVAVKKLIVFVFFGLSEGILCAFEPDWCMPD